MTNTSARSTAAPCGYDGLRPNGSRLDHPRSPAWSARPLSEGDRRARFTPNEAEIAEVLEFPLSELMARSAVTEFDFGGRRVETNLFDMDGHVIWGATARILRDFLDLVESVPAADRRQKGA